MNLVEVELLSEDHILINTDLITTIVAIVDSDSEYNEIYLADGMKYTLSEKGADNLVKYLNYWTDLTGDEIEIPHKEKEPFMNKPCISENACYNVAVQRMRDYKYCVDRRQVLDLLHLNLNRRYVIEQVKNMPSVYPRPKEGYWIPVYQGDEIIDYRCTECEIGSTYGKSPIGMNFCPNCGSMNKVQNKENNE